MNKPSFKQYLDSLRSQLTPVIEQAPRSIKEYNISKYTTITLDGVVHPVKPQDKIVVEWDHTEASSPLPTKVSVTQHKRDAVELTEVSGPAIAPLANGKLHKWLSRYTSASRFVNRPPTIK